MTPKCPDCKRDQDDCVCTTKIDRRKEIRVLEGEIATLTAKLSEAQRDAEPNF